MHEGCIHIWVPGIREGAGGIQAFSRVYVQAVRESHPWAKVRVFVKNDEPSLNDPLRRLGIIFHSVSGTQPWLRTLALVACGLGFGLWERPVCAVTTHLHFLPALCWLKWLRKVPVMSVLHGIEAWNLRGGPRVQALQKADHLLAVSRHTRQAVVDLYDLDASKVSVVPNTFETPRFTLGEKPKRLLERYGLRPGQPVLMTVSRLALTERYKGHRQVLVALEMVRRQFPDVCYLIVGVGDDMPRLREAVAARGLQGHVIFAGHVPGDELPDYYRLCDVFVMPSSKEGFGIVFLEAMACGKPVVAGNVDGSVDALDDGKLGELVDPHDTGEIAAAICRAIQGRPSGALWHDPVALRKAVVDHFGYEQVRRMLADDLAPLLGRQRALPKKQTAEVATDRSGNAPRIVVLTQLTSPYQVEFFNALSAAGHCHLEVIYLTSVDRARQWAAPNIAHDHLILSEMPHLRKDALRALRNADLVVFNFYMDWFTLRAIRSRAKAGRPWVFWGERPGFFQTGVLGVLVRWMLLKPLHRNAVPIWGVGHFGVEGYQNEFGHGRLYHNIPYFSNLRRFLKISREKRAERVFFYSGSLSHRKGIDLLVAAFARLAPRYPAARLVITGTGDLEPLSKYSLRGYADRVTWLGFRAWAQLHECYALGTIFCFPSRYDGWGLALVEALAAGMPCIGTERTGAAVEFLSDGRAGWLIEAGKEEELEKAMEAALNLPDADFARMQASARASVASNGLNEGVQRITHAAKEVLSNWSHL